MNRMISLLLLVFVVIDISGCDGADKQGLYLYMPFGSTSMYLIDEDNQPIYEWKSGYTPGQSAYLDEQGYLIRTGFDEDVNDDGNYFNDAQGHAFGGIIERNYIDAATGKTLSIGGLIIGTI